MTRRTRRIALIAGGVFAAFALLVPAGIILVLRSAWFEARVRERIVSEVERATGGRAEIGAFHFDWRTLNARVAPFVLHGREQSGEPPFVQIASIRIGLEITSILKKDVHIATLLVDRPEVHIIVYPDGRTNVPQPRVRRRSPPLVEQLLKLEVRHFEMSSGVAQIGDARIPLDLRGDDLRAVFDYEAAGPRYRGRVSSRQFHWSGRYIQPVAFDFDSDLVLLNEQLRIENATLATGRSKVRVTGSIHNWMDPQADLAFDSTVAIADLKKVVSVPIERQGDAMVRGTAVLNWGRDFRYRAEGQVSAEGLAYRDSRLRIEGIAGRADYRFDPEGILLPRVSATALGGVFQGSASLTDGFERLEIEGRVQGVGLAGLTRVVSTPALAWSGMAAGPVRIDGRIPGGRARDFTLQADMNITPAQGGIPIEGNVDIIYDQRAKSVWFGNSALSAGASSVKLSGTLGQALRVSLDTRNLDDLRPGLAMISPEASAQIPIALDGGSVSARVTIAGPLTGPVIAGRVTLGRFQWQGRTVDSLTSDITLSSAELVARNATVNQNGMRVTGDGRVELQGWRVSPSSPISAALKLHNGSIEKLLAEAGRKDPVAGTVNASLNLSGTYASPTAAITLAVDRASAYGESFDHVRAAGLLTSAILQVNSGSATMGRGRIGFAGTYRRSGEDWTSGAIQFDIAGAGLTLDQFQHVREYKSGLSAATQLKAAGMAHVHNGTIDLDSLDGNVTLGGITRGAAPIGNLSAVARTRDGKLELQLTGALRGSRVEGHGAWNLSGDHLGRGEVRFTPLTFAALHEVTAEGAVRAELPFIGEVEGSAVITGSLTRPDTWQAVISLPRIEMKSNPNLRLRPTPGVQDLVLRNTEPVDLLATMKSVQIRSARFAATETSIEASGRVTFDAQSPWNASVRGRVNLAILQLFDADLTAQGNAVLNTTIRGPLTDPQVNGRLDITNASLYLADLPAGVDNANGTVTFDRNRANIEKLTAEIGGGRVAFGGFVGLGGGVLLYRVQGNAQQVRFRHPDGASVTVNAQLNLTGTSENGLVSGTITVLRAAFESRADLGSLIAQTAKPLPAPAAPSEYLRGVNFDVRIESGPGFEVQTSLTRDLEAEAELRLRGNAARPLLGGDISISQGEIQFLGNKYSIDRGDIRFINPTKIEPTFDIDLETKARGITVNLSFSGTLNKLNVTYRSDPPLQSNEIIALLAVGRDPTTTAFANAQNRSNLLGSGAGTLSQAVAAPVSSRLQRFFGVSRLKIDPQLTGVENIPQARLTLEQQVSRDITLTYITNLTRTQEQIVRVQWDISRQWSAIAVREENGVFGIDFQYRKRFK